MKTLLLASATLLLAITPIPADEPGREDPFLDHLVGEWVMTGTIAGDEIVHDLDIDWVLNHHYIRIHELSRERLDDGRPAYEAIVFIGWDAPSERYVCLWLDVTGGGGLVPEGFGYGKLQGDAIPFVWGDETGGIHNTSTYDRDADSWNWVIDNVKPAGLSNFAEVTLRRADSR